MIGGNTVLDLSTNTIEMNKISLQRSYRKNTEYTITFLAPLRSSVLVYRGETDGTLYTHTYALRVDFHCCTAILEWLESLLSYKQSTIC